MKLKDALVVAVSVAFATGCSGLKIQPEDSALGTTGKVIVRVPLAIVSFGRSEQWFGIERTMESWLGQPADQLVFSWGRPSDAMPDETGGGMLIYTQERAVLHPGQAQSTTTTSATGWVFPSGYVSAQGTTITNTTYTPAWVERWTVYRAFRVDEAGIVRAYQWRGM